MCEELEWWILNIETAKRHSIYGEPELEIKTDASTNDWAATCSGNTVGRLRSKVEAQNHINYLELLAALFGLRGLCKTARNNHIQIKLDNTTAVTYINAMGGAVPSSCNSVTKTVWEWCVEKFC